MAKDIQRYLWHGYQPPAAIPDWFAGIAASAPVEGSQFTPKGAAERLDAMIDRLVASAPPPYIVPLSGGWDSRIILAALRERTQDIVAVTLGNPGQLDYDVGGLVAKAAGVSTCPVRLDDVTLEWEQLVAAARRAPWTYMPDAFFLRCAYQRALEEVGRTASIWSGFLGDPLTGGHYQDGVQNESKSLAQATFADQQRRVPLADGSVVQSPHCYPSRPDEVSALLSEREFLDFGVRQLGCIAPIVLGGSWKGWRADQGEIYPGTHVIAPFAEAEWAAYWLNAPRHHHQGQDLYRRMAEYRFPELFALPSKYTWGHKSSQRFRQRSTRVQHGVRNRAHRKFPRFPIKSRLTENYLAFQHAFRKRDDYISVIEKTLDVLKQSEATPWLDLDRLWAEHYCGKRDHAQALQVLLGLAVNLEANT